MNILVLKPGVRSIDWSLTGDGTRHTRAGQMDAAHIDRNLQALRGALADAPPETIAVRVNHGGTKFRGPAIADASSLAALTELVPEAPLHLPVVLSLLASGSRVFQNVPTILFFETAFFSRLPRRESAYGIDSDLAQSLGLRRQGYHGIYHEAASAHAIRQLGIPPRRARVLSICLEPHPEIAAVLGNRPVTCTSGATPLEGLPGHTSCGELDPNIVLTLARKLGWGPEQINTALTQRSGLLGLAGCPVMLDDLFAAEAADLAPARAVLENRILSACGAGMAAMGGVDTLVFSGRFHTAAKALGPWLSTRLTFRGGNERHPPRWIGFEEPLYRVIAERAQIVLLESATA